MEMTFIMRSTVLGAIAAGAMCLTVQAADTDNDAQAAARIALAKALFAEQASNAPAASTNVMMHPVDGKMADKEAREKAKEQAKADKADAKAKAKADKEAADAKAKEDAAQAKAAAAQSKMTTSSASATATATAA